MRPEAGLRIGPYQLVQAIGEGGMGVVWRARDTALDRDVAIKFLPAAFAQDPERLARFEREAKAIAALSHPGILAIHGFGEHGGSTYAVTELLEGLTLREILGSGPVPAERARDIAGQVARGLAAAHERGIVHRDLKPENIFVTGDGRAKILDFGLAAYVEPVAASDAHTDGPRAEPAPTRTHLTTPGTLLGTLDYLSPEQLRGLPADTRSDIFSLGSVLFEVSTGRRPFQRATPAMTLAAILGEDPPSANGSSPVLEAAARRCLAKDPAARFASARELAAAIEGASGPTRRGGRLAAVLACLAVIAATLVWFQGRIGAPGADQPDSLTSIGEPPSPRAEANEYLEKGLLFIRSKLDIPRAQSMFDRALEIDPGFGTARAMRALTDVIAINEGFANDADLVYRSQRDLRALVAQQPDLASAHSALGATLLLLNRKEPARQELQAALKKNPGSSAGIAWLAIDDRHSGRAEAAEARLRPVLEAIPLFWAARIMLSEILFDQGRIDEAQREIEKVFEQDPENLTATRTLARVRLYRGDSPAARGLLEPLPAQNHPNFRVRLTWALLLAREGNADAAAAALDAETLKYAGIALFAPTQVAEIYALAGRHAEALDWLERGVRAGDERAAWFRKNDFLKAIREEPRFELILDAIEAR